MFLEQLSWWWLHARSSPRSRRARRPRTPSATMSRMFLLAQLSDPHVGAAWGDRDPEARLAAAVDSVLAVQPRPPGAVLVTGDLADRGTDAEYARVRELLAP